MSRHAHKAPTFPGKAWTVLQPWVRDWQSRHYKRTWEAECECGARCFSVETADRKTQEELDAASAEAYRKRQESEQGTHQIYFEEKRNP